MRCPGTVVTCGEAQIDTARPDGEPARKEWHAGERYPLAGRSLVLMTQSPE
ncbi:MAG: hypothetical protein QM742_16585 [Aquabacterium sp.]